MSRDPFDPKSISAKPGTAEERRRLNMKAAREVDVMQGKTKPRVKHPWNKAAAAAATKKARARKCR